MKDEACSICGQPYAHLFGCPHDKGDRSDATWRCPDIFPPSWLGPISGGPGSTIGRMPPNGWLMGVGAGCWAARS